MTESAALHDGLTPAHQPLRSSKRFLVLNVNDHVAHLYMVSKMLRSAGYQVIEARTGSEAIARAIAECPSVVVLDVQLPDLSGFEVCRRLKARPESQDIKVLHTSATFLSSSNKLAGIEAGADAYLTQPFEPEELIAAVRSLTRLSETEQGLVARNNALVAADRRKDEFLAMLAHELRNPLAAIRFGLTLLERNPPRDAIEARTMDTMARQTTLLTKLVDDLLDVGRVTSGKIELRLEHVDLAAILNQVVDSLRVRLFEPRHQSIVAHVPAGPVLVNADVGRLEQILTNLLDNASKYSDVGSVTEVSLLTSATGATVRVKDQGIGIDPETLDDIFDLFAQADNSLSRARGGIGIGLTLVRALVQLHGGSVAATSEGLGAGTTLILTLPVANASRATLPQPMQSMPVHDATRRVLIIDDNDDGRELFRMLCELRGHEVIEASDGPEGIERTIAERPDIVFVDIGLPTLDGYEVARQVRAAIGGEVRLIALSGYGSPEHRAAAIDAGFDEHVAKPIGVERIEELVRGAAVRTSLG